MQLRTKILSAILLFAFTLSTTGIVMNKHVCEGQVKFVSAFFKAEQCSHSDKVEKDVPKCHQKKETTKKDCCNNDSQELKNKEQSLTYNKISIEQLSVINAVVTASFIANETALTFVDSKNYESPPPVSVRQSLHIINQHFLI